jgi:short-chain fatty acids transporter
MARTTDDARRGDGQRDGSLARIGLRIAEWSEKWFPDPLVFALLGVVCVFVIGLLMGEGPAKLATEGGKAFWSLVPFTMQMVMIIIGGYVVASTPIVRRFIDWLAKFPRTPRGAVAWIAMVSMLTSLISWGLSIIFSGLYVRALAKRIAGMDYRSAGAAAYLGLGAVWAMGLSSSAAMMMATKSAIPPTLAKISGVIPLTQTLFIWPSILTTVLLVIASVVVAYCSTPSPERARTAASYGVTFEDASAPVKKERTRPGEFFEESPILPILVAALLTWHLVHLFVSSPQGVLAALDLPTYNLIFITVGLLMHWTPKRFVRAVGEAVPSTSGVLIQYPLYAIIFGMITGTTISDKFSQLLVAVSTPGSFPLVVAIYSTVLGIFIPSAGSRWVIEAPYVLQAATVHQVHLGWVVQIYNASEALPNLINPFWMLPLLGILKVKARDLVGYGMLQLILHVPLVYLLCWLLARFVTYVAPTEM